MKQFRITYTLKSEIFVTLCRNVCGIYFNGQGFVWVLLLIPIFFLLNTVTTFMKFNKKKLKLKMYMQQTSMNHTLT